MECRLDGYVPIDGKCIKYDSNEHSSCRNADGTTITTQRRCGMCTDSMHLYKGGCYNVTVDTIGTTYLGLDTKPSHVGLHKTPMSGFQNVRDTYVRCSDLYCKICNHDINTCEACIDGYYNSDKCEQCDSNCKTCIGKGQTQCLTCPSNTYLRFLMGGSGVCVDASQCGDGLYADSSSQTCTRCSAGCSTCNGPGEDQCTSCPIRTHFLDDSGSGVGRCIKCGDTTNPKGIAGCRECSSEDGSVTCLMCNFNHPPVDGKCEFRRQDPTNCAEGSCVVEVGENLHCRLCKANGYAPVNGICTDITKANPSDCVIGNPDSAWRCFLCGAGYFLHKGGCYAIGGDPGSFICADEASGSDGTEGVCSTCKTANGFFKNPANAAASDSCIACGETSNVDGVKGVVDCTICKPPSEAGDNIIPKAAICTACETTTPKYLKKADDGTTTCISANECTADQNKFFKVEDPIKKCVSCGDAQGAVDGCDTCTYDSGTKKVTCTKCTSNYLKTAADGTTTCVEKTACKNDYFTVDDSTNGHKCVSCSDATDGVADCAECTAPAQGKTKPACAKCTSGFLHTPEGGETSCPNSCPDGYFGHTSADSGNLQTCQSCSAPKEALNPAVTGIPGCTQCTYAAARANTLKCTACGSGYKLGGETCVSSSANRSSLSTGAIAGISVAAVVVVDGLVGFLCWWFVCHKKM